MSEVRGDDALGGVPFNVSNPAFASGAGSTRVDPVGVEEEVLVFDEVEPAADELVSATEASEEAGDDSEERSDDESAQADEGVEGDEGGEENEPTAQPGADEDGFGGDAPTPLEETTTDVPDGEV